jgi:hypothetical protein
MIVELRTSALFLRRERHQLSGQEVERCRSVRRQRRPPPEASDTGMITPETALKEGQVEVPTLGLNSGSPILIAGKL